MGGHLSRKQLIEYCNNWWLLYSLDDGGKRPENFKLQYNVINDGMRCRM